MDPFERHPRREPASYSFWPILLLAVLVGLLVWRFWPFGAETGRDAAAEPRPVAARGDLAQDEKATIELFKTVSPSVVHITSFATRRTLDLDVLQIPRGTGSGFIWDNEGRIVTNYHVVQGPGTLRVTLGDNTSYTARVIGSLPDKDLAVLHIDAPKAKLKPILVGTSNDLQVGQKVFAIGNPFGLDRTLTTGIISALGREIQSVTRRTIKDVIQTDAAINPGNSGGPLLDSAGRLIGVNTAILSPTGDSWTGIGFAIPVDEVNRIIPELIRHGKVMRPGLGVQVATDQIARELRLKGVLIISIQPDSAAAKAGLQPTRRDAQNQIELGDVITAIDNRPVARVNDLFSALERYKVGATVTVTFVRDGETLTTKATLQAIE